MSAPRIKEFRRTFTFVWDGGSTTHTQLFVATPRGAVFAALSEAYAYIADKDVASAQNDICQIASNVEKDGGIDLKHNNKQLKDEWKVCPLF